MLTWRNGCQVHLDRPPGYESTSNVSFASIMESGGFELMKSKRHSPEQVIRRLAEGDKLLNEGATVAEVARSFGITETTWHRWKNQYGGMKVQDAKRLKELEAENKRLKTIVADLSLDNAMLKELAEGNW